MYLNHSISSARIIFYGSFCHFVDIEGHNVVFDPSAENSTVAVGGTAFFTCVPKVNGVSGLATWIVQPIGPAAAVIARTDNTTNLTGASGVYLSSDRTQLIITGVQNSLHLTSVECRGTDAAATLSPVPADIVYILVQSETVDYGVHLMALLVNL